MNAHQYLIPNMEPLKPLVMVSIPNPITLASTNYLSWKIQVEAILSGYDLLYTHLDGTFPAPPATITKVDDPNNTPVPNPAYQTWFRQDKLIFGALIGTLSSDLIPLISQSKTVHEMWDILAKEFAPQGKCKPKRSRGSNQIMTECEVIDVDQLNSLPSSPTMKAKVATSNQNKRQKINDGDDGITSDRMTMDAISNLPDDILVCLLSFMDMKTAGRTSILSKRWRYVWTNRIDLDFQDPKISMETNLKKIHTEMGRYCIWVNQVITAHRAPYLNFMRIHFPLDGYYYVDNVDKWVEFALRKEVAVLELNFSGVYGHCRRDPCEVLGTVNTLQILRHHNTSFNTPHLKSLHLENVPIYGRLIEKVLSNCINLEHLTLKACFISAFYNSNVEFEIVVSSLKLKHLEFCRCQYVTSLQISAPKLTSLVLIAWNKIEVEYINVASLVDVTFVTSHCYEIFHNFHLFPNFSFYRLEKLSLPWKQANYADFGFPHIRVDNLIVLVSLIEACPLLHTFKLELCYPEKHQALKMSADLMDFEIDNATSMRAHEHLKVVEIVGYDGSASVAKLALCLTQYMHAPMLDKVILDPHYPQFGNGNMHKLYDIKNSSTLGLARRRAKLLAKRIRGGVNVLIL